MQSSNVSLPEEFGRYRIQRKLGEGAMGAVYVAEDTQLKRHVAIKIPQLKPDGSSDLLDRFRLEAQSAATLRNPNICPVYDVGVIDGQYFISMAYIEGKSLAEVLRTGSVITERQILILVRKLALALHDAHQHGIVHRDLKPANIMIDNRGEPVVMDFGLAFQTRVPSERLTIDGQILGSLAYMSPEQVNGNIKSLTQAVDQHALGVTLYELLTHELPYQGSLASIVNQIVNQPTPSPRKLCPTIDPKVDELCSKLMAKKPEHRYPSMRDVADRITAILKTESKANVVEAASKPAVDVLNDSPGYVNGIRDRVSGLLENGDLREALDIVKEIVTAKDVEIRDWARQMQQQIASMIQERKRQLSILANVAAKLIREHDYEEALNVLSAIPLAERSEEIQDLYCDAENKAEETASVLKDIQQAIASDQPKELAPLIRRFLQLKPGNASIRALAEDLKKYGAEELIRIRRRRQNYFDPAPPLFQTAHVAYGLAGLSALALAIYFLTVTYLAPAGTVVVEMFDPRISVNFLNQEIDGMSSERRFALKPSLHPMISVKVDGREVETQEITVKNRETKRIAARLKDGKLDLQITSDLPGFSVPDKDKVAKAAVTDAATAAKVTPPGIATASSGEWLNLMAEPDLNAASSGGIRWKKDGEKLVGTLTEKADSGWLWKISDQKLTGDFDLELDFEVVGADFIEVGLPLKETVGNLKIAKQGTALHWVDNKDLDWKKNRLPLGNDKVRLATGTRQQLRVSVRHAGNDVSLNAEVNGEVACQFNGLRSRISTPKVMFPTPDQLKLATELSRQSDSRIEIYRYRVRELGPGLPASKPETEAPKSPPDSSTKPASLSRILIDADFSKSNGGFANLDVDHILSEHKDGEYRYIGKKVGWWWNGIEPVVGKKENRDLEDFTIELAWRMVGKKKGWFVVRFGLAQKDQLSLCIDEEGAIRLLRGGYIVLVPPTRPLNLKPIDQFNTVKMSVEKKTVRVMVNGEQLFEKQLEQYVGGTVRIWLAPDEVPFDVRLQRLKLETPIVVSPRPISQEVRKLVGHKKSVRGIQFLPGNEQAVSVADDKSFKIWNVTTGQVIHEIEGHPAEVTSVSISEDGRRALTGCADGQARLWDLETRQVIKTLKGHTRPIVSVVLSRDAKMGWAAADDGSIRAWDLKSTAGAKLIAAAGTGTTIEVSANGKFIAAGNNQGQVHVQAGKAGATLVGHSAGEVGGIAFTPGDGQIVTASEDGTLRLWQLSNSKEIHRFTGGGASFQSVSVTGNGRYAIAGNIDRKIYAFDLQTGDTILEIRADRSVNQLLALSPDNHYVLTAGDDDSDLHLWQLPGKLWQAR